MMSAFSDAGRRAWRWTLRHWDKVYLLLEAIGVLGRYDPALEPVEVAAEDAFRLVSPSPRFRQSLRENLTLAARHQQGGLIIERRRSYREALVLSVSAGLLAVSVATAVALIRARPGEHRTT